MLKGFKDFLFRGNIIDLAVAVVVGTAFTALVATVTESLIQPVISRVGGGPDAGGLSLDIGGGAALQFGNVINAIITFLITAAVVYFVFVLPSKKLLERLQAGEEPEPDGPSEDILLLREIRDALGARAADRPDVPPYPDAPQV